ncbi:MAG: hypothetical protein AB1679_35535 [Actinomycetota bacterium]
MTVVSRENTRKAPVLSVEGGAAASPATSRQGIDDGVDQRGSLSWVSRPWLPVLGTALGGLGLMLLVVAYVKVSHESAVALQLPYIVSGGLGGLFALGAGAAVLLARELRLDNERLGDLDRKVSMLGEAVEDVLDDLARLTQRIDGQSRQAQPDSGSSEWA